jgi:tetratricopeptide (TPR) repeat protein
VTLYSRARIVAGAVGLLLTLAASAVSAQPESPREQARAKLGEAKTLYERGEYATALERLEAAQALFPSPVIHFDKGQAQRALARDAEALDSFQRFLSESRDRPEPALGPLRDEAQVYVRELAAKVGSVEVRVNADGADLSIDGRARGRAPLAAAIHVAPGSHQAVVEKPGFVTVVRRFDVAAGARTTIDVKLAPPAPDPRLLLAPPPASQPPPVYRRPWFWAGAGVVLGALVTGTAFALARRTPAFCPDCNGGTYDVAR